MLSFIKRLFSKRTIEEEKDFSATVYEQWTADFSDPKTARFIEEEGDGYSSRLNKDLSLNLYRKNLYAWTVNPRYQYRNLQIDAVIDFTACKKIIPETRSKADTKAGICAFGFLLRYVDEANHLSILISDKGFFRIDAVFNGSRLPLIGWTAAPAMPKKYAKHYEDHNIPVQIILNDTSIAVVINCTLALLLDDDTIQSEGYTAFAGQNWDEYEEISASLCFFSLDSRDIQCDAAYQAWAAEDDFSSEYRMQLARSYSAVGRIVPALIETKKAFAKGITRSEDCIFASRLYLSQNLYEEAYEILTRASSFFTDEQSIIEETASVLYLWGKYDELSVYFKKLNGKEQTSAALASIKGHCLALQRLWEEAYKCYMTASSLNPEQIMHLRNAADMLSKQGKETEALEMQLSLLNTCIEQKDLSGFAGIEDEIIGKKLNPGQKASLLAARGKKAYLEENIEEAKEQLEKYLAKRGINKDREALFALSLIYIDEGALKEAESILQKITADEEARPSYLRTLAECKAKLNQKEQALLLTEKALSLDPADGWALYLKANLLYEKGDQEGAFEAVYASLSVLNEELCVLHLYAKLMKEKGKLDEVLSILDAVSYHSGNGTSYRTDAFHLCANFYAETERFEEAQLRYKKALELSPKDVLLICDYAALCIKMNRINEADSLVSGIFTIDAPVKLYEIIASIAVKKGEPSRAEITLRQGLDEFRDSGFDYCTLLINLAHLYLNSNKIDLAKETIKELISLEKSPRTEEIERELTAKTSREILCSLCSRKWLVPLSLGLIESMRLTAQPPSDLPAGNCPVCGKVYCIGCVEHTLSSDGRFSCPECSTALKIQDKGIFYILNKWNKEERA
jgi:tetratricopeptide (TPR) repeat protein